MLRFIRKVSVCAYFICGLLSARGLGADMISVQLAVAVFFLLFVLRMTDCRPAGEADGVLEDGGKRKREGESAVPAGRARDHIMALLRHLTTGSLEMRERVEGDEGFLVLTDSHSVRSFGYDGKSSTATGDATEGGSSSSGREMEGEPNSGVGVSAAASVSSAEGESGSESGESSADDASGSGLEQGSGVSEAEFQAWLDEELHRMTTVVYDCKERTETVGDWREETRVSAAPPYWSTLDSLQAREQARNRDHGDRTARFIFGEDTREFVDDSRQFPQCAVARMTTGCTAFFITPYHALTAAHCVNSFHYGWKHNRINLWRERNCNHRGNWTTCSRVFSVLGHTHMHMYHYDYALIEMDPEGEPAPCWLGIGFHHPWENPSHFNLDALGYPSDKRPYNSQPECSYEAMWLSTCNESYSYEQYLIQWCDVISGNSGSPLFSEVNGNRVAYGIHAQSVGEYVNKKLVGLWNQGPRITPLRFYQILRWIGMFGDKYNQEDRRRGT